MKKISNIVLMGLMLIGANTFADDIWFISPTMGDAAKGTLVIQIQPPIQDADVRVWIEQDERDRVMWRGKLNKVGNYTTTVDVSKFPAGKYSVKAEYYFRNEDFDGDVDFWID